MNIFEWEEDIPVTANNLNEMQNILNNNVTNGFQKNGSILWANSSPQYGFGADTIQLSETLNNYDMYEIIFQQSTSTERLFTTGKIPVGIGTILCWHTTSNYYRPTATTVSGSSITFEHGKNGGSQDDGSTIPMYVIGYKTGLFS